MQCGIDNCFICFVVDELSSDDDEINEDDVVYIEKLAQKVGATKFVHILSLL